MLNGWTDSRDMLSVIITQPLGSLRVPLSAEKHYNPYFNLN